MRLFHYTDVSAVKSILEKEKLWLTDLRFMNDSEEMSHGINHIRQLLEGNWIKKRLRGSKATEAIKYVQSALDIHVENYMDFNPMFVCSFSRSDDLLSQWRAYGSYSIEFSLDELEQGLLECIYDPGVKSAIVDIAALDTLRSIARNLRISKNSFSSAAHHEYLSLLKLASTLKHESFDEEKEVRMIVEKMDCDYPFLFRARGEVLIPYVEVPISLKNIVGIKVGPMRDQELAYRSMCMFVDEVQRLKDFKDIPSAGIQVTKSEAPFRAV